MVLLNDLFEDFQGAPLSWSPPSLNMGKENKQPVLFQPPFASDGDEDDSPMTYGIRILMSLKGIYFFFLRKQCFFYVQLRSLLFSIFDSLCLLTLKSE